MVTMGLSLPMARQEVGRLTRWKGVQGLMRREGWLPGKLERYKSGIRTVPNHGDVLFNNNSSCFKVNAAIQPS